MDVDPFRIVNLLKVESTNYPCTLDPTKGSRVYRSDDLREDQGLLPEEFHLTEHVLALRHSTAGTLVMAPAPENQIILDLVGHVVDHVPHLTRQCVDVLDSLHDRVAVLVPFTLEAGPVTRGSQVLEVLSTLDVLLVGPMDREAGPLVTHLHGDVDREGLAVLVHVLLLVHGLGILIQDRDLVGDHLTLRVAEVRDDDPPILLLDGFRHDTDTHVTETIRVVLVRITLTSSVVRTGPLAVGLTKSTLQNVISVEKLGLLLDDVIDHQTHVGPDVLRDGVQMEVDAPGEGVEETLEEGDDLDGPVVLLLRGDVLVHQDSHLLSVLLHQTSHLGPGSPHDGGVVGQEGTVPGDLVHDLVRDPNDRVVEEAGIEIPVITTAAEEVHDDLLVSLTDVHVELLRVVVAAPQRLGRGLHSGILLVLVLDQSDTRGRRLLEHHDPAATIGNREDQALRIEERDGHGAELVVHSC